MTYEQLQKLMEKIVITETRIKELEHELDGIVRTYFDEQENDKVNQPENIIIDIIAKKELLNIYNKLFEEEYSGRCN